MESILTVTVAATTHDLTILDTVKEELGISDTTEDTLLQRWIKEESIRIATACNRVFGQETVSQTVRLNAYEGIDAIPLRRFPVVSIASVTENDTALTTDEYEVDAGAGVIYRLDGADGRICWASGKIVIVYVAGYILLDGLPRDIEQACIKLVSHRRAARGRDPYLKAQDIPGVRSQQFWIATDGSGFPPDVEAVIANYRVFSL